MRPITQQRCVRDGTTGIATGLTQGGNSANRGQPFVLRHVELLSRRRIELMATGGDSGMWRIRHTRRLRGSAEPAEGALGGLRAGGLTFEPATPLS